MDMMPSGMRRNLAVYRNLDRPFEVFISARGTEINNLKDLSADFRFVVESLTPDSFAAVRDMMRKYDPFRFLGSLDDLSKPNLRGGKPWDNQDSLLRFLGEVGVFSDILTALGWFLVKTYIQGHLRRKIMDVIQRSNINRWTRSPLLRSVRDEDLMLDVGRAQDWRIPPLSEERTLQEHLQHIDEFLESQWPLGWEEEAGAGEGYGDERDFNPRMVNPFLNRVQEVSNYAKNILKIIKVVDIGTIGLAISNIISSLTTQGFDEWKEWNRNSEKYQKYHQDRISKPKVSVLEHRFAELYTLYKSKADKGDRVFVSGHSLGGIVVSALQRKLKNEGEELAGATFNEGQFLGNQIEGEFLTRYNVRGDPISNFGRADVTLKGTGGFAEGPLARHSLSNFLTKDWEIRRSFDKFDLWSDRSQELSDKWLPFLKETDLDLRLPNFTLREL